MNRPNTIPRMLFLILIVASGSAGCAYHHRWFGQQRGTCPACQNGGGNTAGPGYGTPQPAPYAAPPTGSGSFGSGGY